ncbi:alpha/beta fold hydrolase [Streptomyces sp. NPDC001852]|uniref:alpha/beta fold hydrolase n=1 Tax=Streptomyces sp. NPDC001852 TaxID=3364619 RepID=UPI00367986FF
MVLGRVVTGTGAAAAAIAGGVLAQRSVVRGRQERRLRIDGGRGVDEQYFARIGGIEQWLSVRGDDVSQPVLVEVHGGPGSVTSVFTARTRAWEEHFTVVRWDMRGAGKTLRRGGARGQGEITYERLYEDALEVVDHVRTRLGVERVVIVGHSLGTGFALRLIRSHPERFSAYVGIDHNVHDGGRDASSYKELLERLRAAGRDKQAATVEAMGQDRRVWTAEQHALYHRFVMANNPESVAALKSVVLPSLWYSPLHSLPDLPAFFQGMKLSARIFPDTATFDDWADGTRFAVPFFVFQGALDLVTPPGRARRFFDDVEAPAKHFELVEDAAHFSAYTHPDRFLALLLDRVRPLVSGSR